MCVCVCVCVCVYVCVCAHSPACPPVRKFCSILLTSQSNPLSWGQKLCKRHMRNLNQPAGKVQLLTPLEKCPSAYFFLAVIWLVFVLFVSWLCHRACRILVPRTGAEPMPPSAEVWGLNHWTTREFPQVPVFDHKVLCSQRSSALSVDLIHILLNSPTESVQFSRF